MLESKVERYFARWSNTTRFDLACSYCQLRSLEELVDASILRSVLSLPLAYGDFQGDRELRTLISRKHDTLGRDAILVTTSPTEAIFLSLSVLARKGKNVVVQTPCFPALTAVPSYRGATVRRWDVTETTNSWAIDIEALERLVDRETAAIVLTTPHNPTGAVLTLQELRDIVAIAGRVDACVVSDEVYRGLELDRASVPPSIVDVGYARSVAIGGMSKAYGAPGLHIGWLAAAEPSMIQHAVLLKDHVTAVNSSICERLARAILEGPGDAVLAENRTTIGSNLADLRRVVSARADQLAWREPAGGTVAFLRVLRESSTDFCERLRRDASILAVPSSTFDYGEAHIRIGIGSKGATEAIRALGIALGG